ncbi:Xaa-Pro dipeptidase, M24 metallopeptidase family [Campylobacter blaseri]|uniref:X-Pro aminopeptidase n=1 Tax=Campylobacter blaseri TaxID=2042961 RepID=A0A2P8QZ91_9BACT|nr:aminopeptidase P family protein [Campylobacter blaseri]PSM51566.1 X-Pro aminopeptidase [Campylobacter blaseri]PSM53359.1 X-Pro aminopeptidase [Campylobacter blaseri]QKF86654.1 Xaa-Pro dipeptidase, M24 metallopeptidase family [Campylobacter blaseri]
MHQKRINNYILTDENAVFYECGYSCDNNIFLNLDDRKFFLTDSRYAIEAKKLVKDAEIIEIKKPLIEESKLLLEKLNIKELVFDPNDFSYADFMELSKLKGINFISEPFFSKKKRMIKSDLEIQKLKQAATLGASGFTKFANFISSSKKQLSEKELYYNAELILKDFGNLSLSFNPIIAINENGAKAHALPSNKVLQNGDLLLFDAGVKFERYCSDRTRTAFFDGQIEFSKNQKFKSNKQNEIYEIVKEAQNLAIKSVKPGVLAKDIDRAAREFIKKQGYEKEFFHSTGHGVGIDIHEFPNINQKSEVVLKEGMVFSVEPGIYIEDEFGVRIEDVVVVTKDGCEIL